MQPLGALAAIPVPHTGSNLIDPLCPTLVQSGEAEPAPGRPTVPSGPSSAIASRALLLHLEPSEHQIVAEGRQKRSQYKAFRTIGEGEKQTDKDSLVLC